MSAAGLGFKFDPEWRITLFTLLLVPLMTGLGFWQLQRAGEKQALASSFELRQSSPPAPLRELWEKPAQELAYLPVQLRGSFRSGEYFLLDNRTHKGRFGYQVLAVMTLAGDAGTVLVNRGWIAADPARLTRPDVPAVNGPLAVTGHVYVAPGSPYLLQEQQLQAGWPKLVQAVEMDKMMPPVQALDGGKVFPYVVRIDADAPGALTVDWQVINVSPQKHQGYAVQWFSMAAVLGIFYFLRCSNIWQLLRGTQRQGE
jgi:cytochrome oxidase assembly protein ShyY1